MKMFKLSAIIGVILAVSLNPSVGCQRVDTNNKFPNSDVLVRLKRSSKLQYEIVKGDIR